MKKCKLSPDETKACACLVEQKKHGKMICDVFDEPIQKLKKCPHVERMGKNE